MHLNFFQRFGGLFFETIFNPLKGLIITDQIDETISTEDSEPLLSDQQVGP